MEARRKMKTFVLIAALTLLSNIGFSQNGQIKIKFIGNCGLYLTDGNLNVYVDFPYKSGAFNYMDYDKTELDNIRENSIFIFTHKHPDHYSSKNMRKTLKKKKGKKFGKWNIEELEQLGQTIPNFNVEAIETDHSLSFKHYSYLITWHGKRIYFYGDTEVPDIALTMTNLDWAFVPYWTAVDCQNNNVEIDTEILAVYHFYPHMTTSNARPDKVKLLVNQGEMFYLPY